MAVEVGKLFSQECGSAGGFSCCLGRVITIVSLL
jgi:hypothetical protein